MATPSSAAINHSSANTAGGVGSPGSPGGPAAVSSANRAQTVPDGKKSTGTKKFYKQTIAASMSLSPGGSTSASPPPLLALKPAKPLPSTGGGSVTSSSGTAAASLNSAASSAVTKIVLGPSNGRSSPRLGPQTSVSVQSQERRTTTTLLSDSDNGTVIEKPGESKRYRQLQQIGKGSCGACFLGEDLEAHRLVVIKQVSLVDSAQQAGSPRKADRSGSPMSAGPGGGDEDICFRVSGMMTPKLRSAMNEVRFLQCFDHPNVINYYDSFVTETRNITHIAMPKLTGSVTGPHRKQGAVPSGTTKSLFVERVVNIVMQYAGGGDLNQEIARRSVKGKTAERVDSLSLLLDPGNRSQLAVVSPKGPHGFAIDTPRFAKKVFKSPEGFFQPVDCWLILVQIGLALRYVHQQRILHRDIKTRNIFLTDVGVIKLGDFGIAKQLTDEMAKTLVGSPYFMAPEIHRHLPYDEKSDVWSLGCVLFQVCSLQHAFRGDSLDVIHQEIMNYDAHPEEVKAKWKGLFQGMKLPDDPDSAQDIESLFEVTCFLLSVSPQNRPSVAQLLLLPSVLRGCAKVVEQFPVDAYPQFNHIHEFFARKTRHLSKLAAGGTKLKATRPMSNQRSEKDDNTRKDGAILPSTMPNSTAATTASLASALDTNRSDPVAEEAVTVTRRKKAVITTRVIKTTRRRSAQDEDGNRSEVADENGLPAGPAVLPAVSLFAPLQARLVEPRTKGASASEQVLPDASASQPQPVMGVVVVEEQESTHVGKLTFAGDPLQSGRRPQIFSEDPRQKTQQVKTRVHVLVNPELELDGLRPLHIRLKVDRAERKGYLAERDARMTAREQLQQKLEAALRLLEEDQKRLRSSSPVSPDDDYCEPGPFSRHSYTRHPPLGRRSLTGALTAFSFNFDSLCEFFDQSGSGLLNGHCAPVVLVPATESRHETPRRRLPDFLEQLGDDDEGPYPIAVAKDAADDVSRGNDPDARSSRTGPSRGSHRSSCPSYRPSYKSHGSHITRTHTDNSQHGLNSLSASRSNHHERSGVAGSTPCSAMSRDVSHHNNQQGGSSPSQDSNWERDFSNTVYEADDSGLNEERSGRLVSGAQTVVVAVKHSPPPAVSKSEAGGDPSCGDDFDEEQSSRDTSDELRSRLENSGPSRRRYTHFDDEHATRPRPAMSLKEPSALSSHSQHRRHTSNDACDGGSNGNHVVAASGGPDWIGPEAQEDTSHEARRSISIGEGYYTEARELDHRRRERPEPGGYGDLLGLGQNLVSITEFSLGRSTYGGCTQGRQLQLLAKEEPSHARRLRQLSPDSVESASSTATTTLSSVKLPLTRVLLAPVIATEKRRGSRGAGGAGSTDNSYHVRQERGEGQESPLPQSDMLDPTSRRYGDFLLAGNHRRATTYCRWNSTTGEPVGSLSSVPRFTGASMHSNQSNNAIPYPDHPKSPRRGNLDLSAAEESQVLPRKANPMGSSPTSSGRMFPVAAGSRPTRQSLNHQGSADGMLSPSAYHQLQQQTQQYSSRRNIINGSPNRSGTSETTEGVSRVTSVDLDHPHGTIRKSTSSRISPLTAVAAGYGLTRHSLQPEVSAMATASPAAPHPRPCGSRDPSDYRSGGLPTDFSRNVPLPPNRQSRGGTSTTGNIAPSSRGGTTSQLPAINIDNCQRQISTTTAGLNTPHRAGRESAGRTLVAATHAAGYVASAAKSHRGPTGTLATTTVAGRGAARCRGPSTSSASSADRRRSFCHTSIPTIEEPLVDRLSHAQPAGPAVAGRHASVSGGPGVSGSRLGWRGGQNPDGAAAATAGASRLRPVAASILWSTPRASQEAPGANGTVSVTGSRPTRGSGLYGERLRPTPLRPASPRRTDTSRTRSLSPNRAGAIAQASAPVALGRQNTTGSSHVITRGGSASTTHTAASRIAENITARLRMANARVGGAPGAGAPGDVNDRMLHRHSLGRGSVDTPHASGSTAKVPTATDYRTKRSPAKVATQTTHARVRSGSSIGAGLGVLRRPGRQNAS